MDYYRSTGGTGLEWNMSRPILLKRGFRPLTYTYLYLWQPEENDG